MRPWRITRWYWKLAYVAIGFGITVVIARIGVLVLPSEFERSAIQFVLDFALIVVGARIFRGNDEAVGVVRPWWRMTSRPRLSQVVGVLACVGAGLVLIGIVVWLTGHDPRFDTVPNVFAVVSYGVAAFLYLNSAARLRALAPADTVALSLPTRRVEVTPLPAGDALLRMRGRVTGSWRIGAGVDSVAVFVGDDMVGRLSGPEFTAYASILGDLHAGISVHGARVRNHLWIELPHLAALRAFEREADAQTIDGA